MRRHRSAGGDGIVGVEWERMACTGAVVVRDGWLDGFGECGKRGMHPPLPLSLQMPALHRL